MSRPTRAVTSTSSTAPTPACTSSSWVARRARSRASNRRHPMKRRTIVQTSLAAGLMAGMVALGVGEDGPPSFSKDVPWRLIAWPFPRDAWLPGQAWRRGALEVYVRPKIGFCGNCDTGVVTDEEVDRVTDIDLLDERFVPAKEGLAVRIGNLSGRARLYRYTLIGGGTRHAEGVAVSQKCDLI